MFTNKVSYDMVGGLPWC